MKISVFILIFFVFAALVTAQPLSEHKGIHQVHWEKFSKDTPDFTAPDPPAKGIIPLQPRLAKSDLSAKVFGFLPDWEYPGAMNNLRFDLLTHIAAFDFTVNENGQISNPARWPWTDLINEAHSNGVKVILTAVSFDGFVVHELITNSGAKNAFFNNLKNKMRTYNLDGVNIDFENFYESDRGAPINNFMADLTKFLHDSIPGSEVSIDGPAVNWGDHWDFEGLANSCDYIFIMGYAFAGSWSDFTASTAPLTGGTYNITNTVKVEYNDVTFSQPEKLILGVPYYGHRWQAVDGSAHAAIEDFEGSYFYRSAASGFANYGTLWDTPTSSPWYRYQSAGEWYQVWCENERSLDEKFDLADTYGLGGVGMWALNYDGSRNEFWEVIRQHYASGNPVLPYEPRGLQVTKDQSGDLEVGFEAVPEASSYYVYISEDGLAFNDSVNSVATTVTFEGLNSGQNYFFRVCAINDAGAGPVTGVLAATAGLSDSTVLIVDGFDRTSGTSNPRNYIRRHADAFEDLGISFVSASNEAVQSGAVLLEDYPIVNWFLGDESTADDTFNPAEQSKVKSYLQHGGNLLVSGAEVGWDLVSQGNDSDNTFYRDYLKASYVSDAPNNNKSTYYTAGGMASTPFASAGMFDFDDGNYGTFDVDWPDAIKGATGGQLGFSFDGVNTSSGGAGIYYSGTFGSSQQASRLVYLSVPVETVYPLEKRVDLLQSIMDFFDEPLTTIEDKKVISANDFRLLPNYPNPFNPSTTIRFVAPSSGEAFLQVYDIQGRVITASRRNITQSGEVSWQWPANGMDTGNLSSGVYIYRVIFETKNGHRVSADGRMNLIR